MQTTALTDSPAAPPPRRLLPVIYIGVFMAALDTAVVGPAIPALRTYFNIDNREVGLVMSVFVLFSLCSTALMANLSDRHGRRPVYLLSVSLFALGSLLIALSPRFWMLIASRAIQGIGAGGITPTASAVVGDTVPPEQRGRALGMIGATYGMAFVLGPPLASALMVAASWHWIFLLNLPVAAVILSLGAKVLPPRRADVERAPLDWQGIIVTFVLLTTLVLGITRVVDGFTGLSLWPYLLATTGLLLAVLVLIERRAVRPLIPFSLLSDRQLALTYVLAVGAGFGMGSIVFLTSIPTQAYGVTPKNAGFMLLPLVLSSMVGSMGAGRLLNRLGPRGILLIGFGMLALGYGGSAAAVDPERFFAGVSHDVLMSAGLGLFLVASMPVGLGVGIVVGGALRSMAIDKAPATLRAAAQGLINICTAIGTLTAAAAVSAVADFGGGGARGFGIAYVGVAALMLVMLFVTLGLRDERPVGVSVSTG
jgi:MFS family permease